jgi:hypothetical protein
MSNNKFKKAPLSITDKEKKAEEFINLSDNALIIPQNKSAQQISQKEPTKSLIIRIPESFRNDLTDISNLSGLSLNSVCLELLRPAIKKKLKELRED